MFVEKTRESHRQSDEHWNCFKGYVGKTSEASGGRWVGEGGHMDFSELIDTIVSCHLEQS